MTRSAEQVAIDLVRKVKKTVDLYKKSIINLSQLIDTELEGMLELPVTEIDVILSTYCPFCKGIQKHGYQEDVSLTNDKLLMVCEGCNVSVVEIKGLGDR